MLVICSSRVKKRRSERIRFYVKRAFDESFNAIVNAGDSENKPVVLGRINGLHGVRGWMKIFSYTSPRENIFTYESWLLEVLPGSWEEKKNQAMEKAG